MTEITPTRAYDLLTSPERDAVDGYLQVATAEQHRRRQRIIHILDIPIPMEYIRRSNGALSKPLVLAALAERVRELAAAQDISPDRVIKEVATIAFSNIKDYFDPGAFGQINVKSLDQIPDEAMAAVKSIEIKPGAFGLHTKVVLHDKQPAIKALAEMMGIVAPDKAPPLQEYIAPPRSETEDASDTPEDMYAALLSKMGSR